MASGSRRVVLKDVRKTVNYLGHEHISNYELIGNLAYFRSEPGAVPEYRELIRQGRGAHTELQGTITKLDSYIPTKVTFTTGSPGFESHGTYDGYDGAITPGLSITTPDLPLVKFDNLWVKKLINANRKVNLSTTVFEIRSTLDLLRNPLSYLTRLMTRRHRKYKGKRILARNFSKKAVARAVAGTNIEFAFGIMPIIYDITGVVDALNTLMKRKLYKRVDYRVKTESTVTYSESPISIMGQVNAVRTDATITTGAIWYRGVVRLKPGSRFTFGFDPASLVMSGLEVIPWSFLIDYVYPLSRQLDSLMFRESELVWSLRTRHATTTRSSWCRYASGGGGIVTSFHGGKSSLSRTTFLREPYTPQFHLEGIDVTNRFGALLNSVSLLVLQRR